MLNWHFGVDGAENAIYVAEVDEESVSSTSELLSDAADCGAIAAMTRAPSAWRLNCCSTERFSTRRTNARYRFDGQDGYGDVAWRRARRSRRGTAVPSTPQSVNAERDGKDLTHAKTAMSSSRYSNTLPFPIVVGV